GKRAFDALWRAAVRTGGRRPGFAGHRPGERIGLTLNPVRSATAAPTSSPRRSAHKRVGVWNPRRSIGLERRTHREGVVSTETVVAANNIRRRDNSRTVR